MGPVFASLCLGSFHNSDQSPNIIPYLTLTLCNQAKFELASSFLQMKTHSSLHWCPLKVKGPCSIHSHFHLTTHIYNMTPCIKIASMSQRNSSALCTSTKTTGLTVNSVPGELIYSESFHPVLGISIAHPLLSHLPYTYTCCHAVHME